MFKVGIAAFALISGTPNFCLAADPDALGSIWREGQADNKTWIIGTFRSVGDLDQLAAQETHPENARDPAKPLHEAYFRFEAECSDDNFAIRVKANAAEQERPFMKNESPYSFEDSPLSEASVIVDGKSSLNLHYLWGAISGTSNGAIERTNLAGSAYRFLKQIDEQPMVEIKLFTPQGSAAYRLDRSYQEESNSAAIGEFKKQCAAYASNWH